MGLQITSRKSGNVTILDLHGRIIIGSSNDSLGVELRKFADAGPSEVIVNLAGVTQMDSSGLGVIAGLYISAKAAGCRLELINLSKRVRELMSLTNLLLLFEQCGEHNVRVG